MNNKFGLYLVMTDPVVGYEKCAQAAVDCKLQFVQLRMKNTPREIILSIARNVRQITVGTSTKFIINDDVTLAKEVDADGVHLGQDDMSLEEARSVWDSPNKIFGLSTHNEHQLLAAVRQKPDYIGIGPVFPTPTKAIPDPALGVEYAGHLAKLAPIPHVVLGGIDRHNLKEILIAGAVNYSAVRAIMKSHDPKDEIITLQTIWENHSAEADLIASRPSIRE